MKQLENAYALVIGVDYKQKTPQPVRDAQAIYDLLCDEKLCGYKKENVTLLLDDKATMDAIIHSLDNIVAKSDANSSFLLYYSGHGGYDTTHKISYLCPHDKILSNSNYVSGQEIRERISKMESQRIIILFDCCHSGSFFEGKDHVISDSIVEKTKTQIIHNNSTLEGLAQEIDDERGMVIVASSQAAEESWGDFINDDYSVFTTCLMEAFRAKNKHFFADEFVRTVETVNYVFERTPQLIEILKQRSDKVKDQTPYANLQMSADFTICYIPEELRSKIVTGKFKAPSEEKETVLSKSDTDLEWERDEGNSLLLFVHGFSGESGDSFGLMPNLLQADPNFKGWAMKPLGYKSIAQPKLGKDIWGAVLDVDKIAGNLRTSIKFKFKNYDRIAIVAHSLGGIVAQKAILGLESEDRNRISHLIMFGTPSNGIAPEVLEKQWNKKYRELSSTGNFITTLRANWDDTFKGSYPFKLKVAASAEDEYVSVESCHKPFDQKNCEFVNGKHLMMIKPKDEKDDAYSLVVSTLTGSKFFNQFTDKEEINLTLGKYDAVVNDLLPIKEDLDKRGLTQLIFALEGLERTEEVYNLLNTHPLAKSNTDLMGIIGGRHKRDYLKTYSFKSSQASRDYYSKALEISVENEAHSQIYYHAINLAFLSIVTDPETGRGQMKKYASQALESAEKCDDNLWKFATVAEANMYLSNFDKAKEYYIKASDNIPIREKLSMHTNAYAGYVALTGRENDEFTQFLKAQLLS